MLFFRWLNIFDAIFNLDFFSWAEASCAFRFTATHYFKMQVMSLVPLVVSVTIFAFKTVRKLWLMDEPTWKAKVCGTVWKNLPVRTRHVSKIFGAVILAVIGGLGGYFYGRLSDTTSLVGFVIGGAVTFLVVGVLVGVVAECSAKRTAEKNDKLEHAGAPQAPDAEEGAGPPILVEGGSAPSMTESLFGALFRQAEPPAAAQVVPERWSLANVFMTVEEKDEEEAAVGPKLLQEVSTFDPDPDITFDPDPIWHDEVRLNKSLFWTIFLYFIFFAYPSVCLRIMRTFDCDTNFSTSKGERGYLRADYSQECLVDGEQPLMYQKQEAWATSFVVLFVLGVPFFYLVILYRYRTHLYPDPTRILLDVLIDKLREKKANTYDLSLKRAYTSIQSQLLKNRDKVAPKDKKQTMFEYAACARPIPKPPSGGSEHNPPIPYKSKESKDRIHLLVSIIVHMEDLELEVEAKEKTLEAQSNEQDDSSTNQESAAVVQQSLADMHGADNENESGIDLKLKLSTLELQKQLVMEYRQQDPHIQHLAILWSSYEPKAWYFEAVECIRRLLLTGLLGIIPRPSMQIVWASWISMVFLIMYGYFTPFALSSADHLQTISQAVTFMQLFMGLLIVEEVIPMNTVQSRTIVIILMGVLHVVVLAYAGSSSFGEDGSPIHQLITGFTDYAEKVDEKFRLSEKFADESTGLSNREVVDSLKQIGVRDAFRADAPREASFLEISSADAKKFSKADRGESDA